MSESSRPSPPIVVTGLGVVAPTGLGAADHWAATLAGKSAIGLLQRFDASGYPHRLAGEIPGFDPAEHLPSRLLPQTDRMTQLALVASDWALADAGVRELPDGGAGVGVSTAAAAGGFEFGQRELQHLWSKGPGFVSAYQSFAWFYAVNSGQISIRHGLRGHSGVVVSDQAGGLDALAHAGRRLRNGMSMMLAGGVEASLCPWGWVAQSAAGRMSRSDDPARAYLPFGEDANGYVPGEGGALLVLETEPAALARGARVYAHISGYAATFDPRPGGPGEVGPRRAIHQALSRAGLTPGDIDVVFADGAGVPAEDRVEAAAIVAVFGRDAVPVTVPKTMTGRLYSGAGALDVATACLAVSEGIVPPTADVGAVDPDLGLDLVRDTPRPGPIRNALVLARGHHGFNSALVVSTPAHP